MFKWRKFLSFVVAVVLMSIVAVGCGKEKGTVEGYDKVYFSEEGKIYQYQAVNLDKVAIKLDGKETKLSELPEDQQLVMPVKAYTGEYLSFGVGVNKYMHALGDKYVRAENIKWLYDGEVYLPEEVEQGSLDMSKLKGIITYEDSEQRRVNVVDYRLENVDGEVTMQITDGFNVFVWETAESGLHLDVEEEEEALRKRQEKEGYVDNTDSLELLNAGSDPVVNLDDVLATENEDNTDDFGEEILNEDDIEDGVTIGADDGKELKVEKVKR